MADDTDKKNILSYQKVDLSPKMQEQLNQPLKTDEVDPKDQEFLDMLVKKIEAKEIDLFTPTSLMNHDVYDKLDETAQGKADYDAYRLLPKVREIFNLHQQNQTDTYQFKYLVHEIRLLKEQIESVAGDIFII